jgi:hypothetical protein
VRWGRLFVLVKSQRSWKHAVACDIQFFRREKFSLPIGGTSVVPDRRYILHIEHQMNPITQDPAPPARRERPNIFICCVRKEKDHLF